MTSLIIIVTPDGGIEMSNIIILIRLLFLNDEVANVTDST